MPIRRRQLLFRTAVAALGLPATVASAADPGVSEREIVIGQSITLQAGKAVYGGEAMLGVKLVFDEVNRNGGVNGRSLVLRTLDDDNQASHAEANARKLVADGAFLLFGSIEGGPSTAVMQAAIDLKVPFFGPMAGSPTLRRPYQPLVFPVRAEHREEFRALIEHARSIGLQRVALFHADTDTGRAHLENVRLLATELGLGFGGGAAFKSDITDAQLDAVVAGFVRQRVDVVFNHGSAALYERLIRRARASGARLSLWGVNSGSTPMAASLGPLAHGMVFSQIVPSPWARKSALTREYQERLHRAQPDAPLSYGSLEGYLTAKALVAVLREAGSPPTRAGLLKALQSFDTDFGGVRVRYRGGDHIGSNFVDLALVGRDGRFVQ
jgi:ABC-type branched-subunit amino acid transport system substrate-binding protein